MVWARCEICRLRLPTLRKLMQHYINGHSKLKIIQSLLKPSILLSTTKNKTRNFKRFRETRIFSLNYPKKETLYLNDNIHILCGRNEIIIGDEKSSVGMEFSFKEQISPESKEKKQETVAASVKAEENNNTSKETKSDNENNPKKSSHTSRTKSGTKKTLSKSKKKLAHKKKAMNPRHYRINITKLEERSVLNEKSGDFYICSCRGQSAKNFHRADLQIFTRDADKLSEKSDASVDPRIEMKAFCSKCGNGYKSDEELMEHMKIHEMHCRVCNEIFPTEQQFKDHTSTHIFKVYACHLCDYEYPFKQLLHKHFQHHMDNEVVDTVLDMENDYKVSRHNFSLLGHQGSVNSILRFLSEGHDVCYYSYKYMKTICDICYHELYVCDYEQHLQNVHYQYSYS